MSEFASPRLVGTVQAIITGTFDVTEQEAHVHASRLVMLAEDWGGRENAPKLSWAYLVKKDLGEKLRWKSEAERKEFYADKEQWYKDYNTLIGGDEPRRLI